MSLFNCNPRCNCAVAALIVSVIVGVLTAFFQITGMVTATVVFLWVLFGIAAVYLVVLVAASVVGRRVDACLCNCTSLNLLLIGLLGTIGASVVLLAFGVVATSAVSAILVGVLLFFFTLTLTSSACYVRCLANCEG